MRAKSSRPRRRCPGPWPRRSGAGNLGIMDYYRMKNVQADTDMRDAIARPERDDTDVHRGK